MTPANPNVPLLIDKLRAAVDRGMIRLEEFIVWHSGVYALLDCVFSAQVQYARVVLPDAPYAVGQATGTRRPNGPDLLGVSRGR